MSEREKGPSFIEIAFGSDDRRAVTVDDHAAFRESIATPLRGDEIDELIADIRHARKEETV